MVWVEGAVKVIQLQTPSYGQRHLPLDFTILCNIFTNVLSLSQGSVVCFSFISVIRKLFQRLIVLRIRNLLISSQSVFRSLSFPGFHPAPTFSQPWFSV